MADVQGYAQLQARLHAIGGTGSASIMNQIGLQVVREAKLLVPRKTANLGRSIRVTAHSAQSVTVAATAPYAAYVELGTKAHEITPNAKRALRWATSSSKGFRLTGRPSSAKGNQIGWQFATIVHHPGTRAHPYLLPAAKMVVAKVGTDEIVAAWNGAA